MNQKLRHFNRYISKNGYCDVWARELVNGWFEIDDLNRKQFPLSIPADLFLDTYEEYYEDDDT